MPRIDPQEFEQRAQRLRKAIQDRGEARAAKAAVEERVQAADQECQKAHKDFEEYVEQVAGLTPKRDSQ